jgi:Fic family protein
MQLVYLKVDERLNLLQRAEECAEREVIESVAACLDASWVYHDLSVEGSIFRDDELQRALSGREGSSWRESQLFEKVRNMRGAIQFVREQARRGRAFDLELVKELHRAVRPSIEEAAGRYRKDGGDNTVYRHDVVSPKTISYRLRRLVAQIDASSQDSPGHPIAMACTIHRELIEVYPFHTDNGLVARLAMNFWLLRHGYPPAIVHVQDRQRYFDSYLSANGEFRELVVDSILQSVDAWVRGLADHRQLQAFAN